MAPGGNTIRCLFTLNITTVSSITVTAATDSNYLETGIQINTTTSQIQKKEKRQRNPFVTTVFPHVTSLNSSQACKYQMWTVSSPLLWVLHDDAAVSKHTIILLIVKFTKKKVAWLENKFILSVVQNSQGSSLTVLQGLNRASVSRHDRYETFKAQIYWRWHILYSIQFVSMLTKSKQHLTVDIFFFSWLSELPPLQCSICTTQGDLCICECDYISAKDKLTHQQWRTSSPAATGLYSAWGLWKIWRVKMRNGSSGSKLAHPIFSPPDDANVVKSARGELWLWSQHLWVEQNWTVLLNKCFYR